MDIPSISGFKTDTNLDYQLNYGNNLISFPSDESFAIEDVLPENLDGVLYGILGEGQTALYDNGNWYGSLTAFEGFKGYWFKTNESADFSFPLPMCSELDKAAASVTLTASSAKLRSRKILSIYKQQ